MWAADVDVGEPRAAFHTCRKKILMRVVQRGGPGHRGRALAWMKCWFVHLRGLCAWRVCVVSLWRCGVWRCGRVVVALVCG